MKLFHSKPKPQPQAARVAPQHQGVRIPDVMGPAFDAFMSGDTEAAKAALGMVPTQRIPLHKSIMNAASSMMETVALQKGAERDYWAAQRRVTQAAAQGTWVNQALDYYGAYDSPGIRDKTGQTMSFLRMLSTSIEPVSAIIGTRINQVVGYAERAVIRRGVSPDPGFVVGLSNPGEAASSEDREICALLEQYMEECGFGPPPIENRLVGWQPGLAPFLSGLVRDRLTLDHVCIRRWQDTTGRWPVAAFALEDAGLIRNRRRELVAIEGFHKVEVEAERARTNTKREIAYVKVDGEGGQTIEEFTRKDLAVVHQRERTDREANGYGFAELEELVNTSTMWAASRDFNQLRFSKNTLPRGILALMGNLDHQAFASFRTEWKQMMQGVAKQWNIPIVKGLPDARGGVSSPLQWVPFDLSPKDMEHQQTMFTMAIWAHAIYQIHPEETGWAATSPFRPPLSEASPETNLKYSQDTGLRPLLKWIAGVINREIIWKLFPSRRYKFKFVGIGDYDQLQDVQVRTARLQAGLSTPAHEWDELDVTMPKEIRSHPAADFPAPFAVGYQMIEASAQQQQQTEQAQQEQMMAGQQNEQQAGLAKFQAARQAQAQGFPGEGEGRGAGGPPAGGGGSRPVGTPPGVSNPASPVLKAMAWPFIED